MSKTADKSKRGSSQASSKAPASKGPTPRSPVAAAAKSRNAPAKPARRTIPRFVIILAIVAGVGIVLTAGSFTFAATQEQRDPFCASCHTQPESTFFSREAAAAADLASSHHGEGVRCIDCHSGPGLDGRVRAEIMGAHNALLWYTGKAVQPAPLTSPISDANCLKCHDQVLTISTMQNHFHFFLSRWQQRDPKAAKCTTCHEAHTLDGSSDIQWLNQDRTVVQCQACHSVLRGGDE